MKILLLSNIRCSSIFTDGLLTPIFFEGIFYVISLEFQTQNWSGGVSQYNSMEIPLQYYYEMRYWRQMRRSVRTVLYSPSMISSLSVDLAVTFSLPGVPASNCSIWHTQMQKNHEKENPLCFCQAYSWEIKHRMQDGTVMNLVLDNWTQIKDLSIS